MAFVVVCGVFSFFTLLLIAWMKYDDMHPDTNE